MTTPENLCNFSHTHGHSGVAGVGLLNRVHGKGADDTGQGGKSNGHDNLPSTERGFSRMGKLSAKTGAFATLCYGLWMAQRQAGLAARLTTGDELGEAAYCGSIQKQKLIINRKKFNF